MADLSRATNPSNYFDTTSAYLLKQPEPQYLHARLWLNAMNANLLISSGELGLPGRMVAQAGAPYPQDLDQLLLSDPVSTELIQGRTVFSGLPGHTVRFNRPAFTNSTYTQASRLIATGQTISTTTISPAGEQNELTLKRYAGPYDATASEVRPYGIDQFDAQVGVHQSSSIVGLHLSRDFHRTIDAFNVALCDAAATTVYPEGMSADNDATGADFPLSMEQINRTQKEMDEANLPVMSDGRRVLIVTPTGEKQLKDDPQFMRAVENHKEGNPLYDGQFVAKLPGWWVFKSNTLSKVDNSSSIEIHRAQAIAPGALLGGIGSLPVKGGMLPGPRVLAATDDNYGFSQKVIWALAGAFGLADNRFVVSVRYTEDPQ